MSSIDQAIVSQTDSTSSHASSPQDTQESHAPTSDQKKEEPSSKPPVKKRVRTGCLNCRRKHKKCDEVKPICTTCAQKNEICEWPNPKLKKSMSKPDMFSSFNFPQNAIYQQYRPQMMGATSLSQHTSNNGFPMTDPLSFKRQRLEPPHQMLSNSFQNSNVPSTSIAHGLPSFLPPNIQEIPSANALHRPSPFGSTSLTQHQQSQPQSQDPQDSSEKQQPFNWKNATSSVPQGITSLNPINSIFAKKDPLLLPSGTTYEPREYILTGSAAYKESETILQNYLNKYEVPLLIPALNLKPNLTPMEESLMLKFYIEYVAPQFDFLHVSSNVFRNILVSLFKHSEALRYSVYALTLVHWEKSGKPHNFKEEPLRLFQMSVAQLVKNSSTFSNSIRASTALFLICFCLTVDDESKWRNNVNSLISFNKSEDIRPVQREMVNFSLFWATAVMDIGATELMKDKTVLTYDFESLRKYSLIPQIIAFLSKTYNLLASDGPQENFDIEWEQLWIRVNQWGEQIEEEHLEAVKEVDGSPFPHILCHSPCSAFGNQIYLTTKILLYQEKPRAFRNKYQLSHSLAWYARRICAINKSNEDLRNLFSSPLCISIAGKVFTHQEEHTQVLELLSSVQKKFGTRNNFRVQDLKANWDDKHT